MASQGKNIAQSVADVIGAFDKAVDLVRRIEDRKDVKDDPQALHDLYQSLALGGEVMRNYFEADSKRLGQGYIQGDYQARHQILDILIGLKDLVSNLQTINIDGGDLNPISLKEAFDVHRLEAGMCLSQLSLRLTANANMFHGSPPAYMSYYGGSNNGLHYSSSQSTHSSSGGRYRSPMTPEPVPPIENLYKFNQLNLGGQDLQSWQMAMATRPDFERTASGNSFLSDVNHQRRDTEASIIHDGHIQSWATGSSVFKERDAEELSTRRPSSHTLAPEDTALLSPASADAGKKMELPLLGEQDLVRDSYTSFTLPDGSRSLLARQSNNSSRPSHLSTTSSSRDRFDPDDFSPINEEQRAASTIGPFFPQISDEGRQSVTSYASRAAESTHSTLESASTLEHFRQQNTPQPLRLPSRQAMLPQQHNPGPIQQHFSLQRKPLQNGLSPSYPLGNADHTQHLYQPNPAHHMSVPIPVRFDQNPPALPPLHPQRSMNLNSPPPRSTSRPSPNSPAPQTAISRPPVFLSHDQSFNHTIPENNSPQFSPAPLPEVRTPYQLQPPRTATLDSPLPITPPPARPVTAKTTVSEAPSVQTTASKVPSIPIPPIPNAPLTLPTEKSPLPLCKGAFRLFIGLNNKSFTAAYRPTGLSGMVSYWRCKECFFEGPMALTPALNTKKKGKQDKIFDPTIRESNGIRYNWIFLAKCHVALKSNPDMVWKPGYRDGSFGSFACIFCTAEGNARGWNRTARPGTAVPADVSSVRSGSSGGAKSEAGSTASGIAGAPTFGNLQSFIEHLQMHREEAGWPCEEMRGRMKAVVGRMAGREEEWEVNFTPLAS